MITTLVLIVINIVCVGFLAYFIQRENKARERIMHQEDEMKRSIYELTMLKNLSTTSGYSLEVEKIVEGIVATVSTLMRYTSASYGLIKNDKIIFRMRLLEPVGPSFIKDAKMHLLNSMYEIDSRTRSNLVEEQLDGRIDEKDISTSKSYFNVPLVVHNNLVCVISIASKMPNAFLFEDSGMIYKIINQATSTIERLQRIIETEKGKLNSLLLSIPTGAVMFSIIDNILEVTSINTSAKEYLGLSGEPDTFQVITSFGKSFNLADKIRIVLEEKKIVTLENIKISDRNIKIFISPVFLYGTGKVIGVSITMEDITFEKQIQEVRETFTNMVVHELRAPLTSMKGASELLISGKLQAEDQNKMLHLIKDSTERMLGDISDLLDASKIEAGKFAIGKSRASINSIIESRIAVFIHMAEAKGIAIQSSLYKDIPLFEFDVERIGQVMNNLLSNSIKYTHQGGIIKVISSIEGNMVKIQVADNGIGVPKEKQTILFGRYSQAGQGGFRSGSTGLGLYISKSIIQSHGGKISLISEEGKGTDVVFTVPMENPVVAQKPDSSFMSASQKYLN